MAIKQIYVGHDYNGNKITNVADGVGATDVVNKGQLDAGVVEAKAYTDAKIEGLGEYVSKIDPVNGLPTVGSGTAGAIDRNDWYYIESNGTLLGVAVHKGDRLQALVDNPDVTTNDATNTDWNILHSWHIEDSRYEIVGLSLIADTPETITHNLGYKFVQTSFALTSSGKKVELDIAYVDENTITIESNISITIDGIISL